MSHLRHTALLMEQLEYDLLQVEDCSTTAEERLNLSLASDRCRLIDRMRDPSDPENLIKLIAPDINNCSRRRAQ